MRDLLRNLTAGAILFCATAGVAGAAEPLLGTWKMNPAKSQFNPGPPPKEFTRVFKMAGDAIDMEISGVAPDGKTPFTGHAVFKIDDKDYPIVIAGDSQTISVKRIDALRYETTMKKEGKVVSNVATTISADGKVFSQILKTADASGAVRESTMVFDRQ